MVVLSKPVAAIAVLASLFSSVAASPINSLEQLESRQTGSFYAITGVKIGGVQPRLEIRDLQKQPEQWNLFILALQRFQAQGQSVRESFYQVAGIHGEPYYPWDGVKGSGQIGYCTHASNL